MPNIEIPSIAGDCRFYSRVMETFRKTRAPTLSFHADGEYSPISLQQELEIDEKRNMVLLVKACDHISNVEDQMKIGRAIALMHHVHQKQRRDSGEFFSNHCLRVATILAEMKLDADTIAAGIIHDVLENAQEQGFPVSSKDIRRQFGKTVYRLALGTRNSEWDVRVRPEDIEGYERMDEAALNLQMIKKYDNLTHQKILKQFSGQSGTDPRVVLIKLADRVDNMKTLKSVKDYHGLTAEERQKQKARDSLKHFSLYAKMVGEDGIRNELADLGFEIVKKKQFTDVWRAIQRAYRVKLEKGIEEVDWISPERYRQVLAGLTGVFDTAEISRQMVGDLQLDQLGLSEDNLTVYLPGLYGMYKTWEKKRDRDQFGTEDLYVKMAIRIPDDMTYSRQTMPRIRALIRGNLEQAEWEDITHQYKRAETTDDFSGEVLFVRHKKTGQFLKIFITKESDWMISRSQVADCYREADYMKKRYAERKLELLKAEYKG